MGASAASLVLGIGPYADRAISAWCPRGNAFRLGVASGDPLPSGVVLWTRLAPSPLAAGHLRDPLGAREEETEAGRARAEGDADR